MSRVTTKTILKLPALTCLSAWMFAVAGAQAIAQTTPTDFPANSMRALIERYSADQDSLRRVYTDRLSPTTRQRMSDFQATWRQQLAEVKFEALDQEGKADYLLLKNHLDRVEHRSAVDEAQWKEVEPLLPFAAGIFSLEDARRRVEPANGEQIASQLNAMATAIAGKRKKLEATLAPPKAKTDQGK